jgi:hypothetical protein
MPSWSHSGRKIAFSDRLKRVAILTLTTGKVVHVRLGQMPRGRETIDKSHSRAHEAAHS